jgi:hypothetical protein
VLEHSCGKAIAQCTGLDNVVDKERPPQDFDHLEFLKPKSGVIVIPEYGSYRGDSRKFNTEAGKSNITGVDNVGNSLKQFQNFRVQMPVRI